MARLRIDNHQYQLRECGEHDDLSAPVTWFARQQTAGPGVYLYYPGQAVIRTGIESGWLDIDLAVHHERTPRLRGWDEEHDAEGVTTTGELILWSMTGGTSEPPLLRYISEPGSPFHLRFYVSGRGGPDERHHLQLWPLEGAPATAGPGVLPAYAKPLEPSPPPSRPPGMPPPPPSGWG